MRASSKGIHFAVAAADLLVALAFGVSVESAKAAAGYCAFEVAVKAPFGKPLSGVPVTLVKGNQSVVEVTTSPAGLARICDSPVEVVSVIIGSDICGSVVVRNVTSRWPKTERIDVIYAERPCDHLGIVQQCQLLLRIIDTNGRPVAGAVFVGSHGSREGSKSSDDRGRLFKILTRGSRLEGVVVRGKLETIPIAVDCQENRELVLRLKEPADR